MTTIFLIAKDKADFRANVDAIHTSKDYRGERFAYVAGPHSLYGVDLTPERVVFCDGWQHRDDAAEIINQLNVRMKVHAKIAGLVK